MPEALVIHRPPGGKVKQLVLLFHGVGSAPPSMAPLGRRLAAAFPDALVVAVPGAHASDLGQGLQWFSVRGVTEANRGERVAQAMPLFVAAVREQQAAAGVGADETVLVGFSQGAIMALESAARGHRLARRIVSIAGRFADRPAAVPEDVAFHLLHGADDPVIAYRDGERAEQALVELGTVATIDVLPATGHTVSVAMEHLVVRRLQSDTPSATH